MTKKAPEISEDSPEEIALQKRRKFIELEKQRNEGLRQLGEFLFEFSQLEFTIKSVVCRALKLEDEYFDIVTGPYDFAVLCSVAEKVLEKRLPKSKDVIVDVCNRCRRLNDERVRASHGLWTDGEAGVEARHVSRRSLEAKVFFDKKDDLKKLADEAQALMQAVLNIK